ncbi:hypothetical protein AaE_013038 [Aphanomyces astaci]|uniref:Reverse transcriptase Ty1/copia-type domain-containing protein n=1 Tax=Aphanomyces astaci TaxID=112090 RepID=A0A6A4ZK07_APHAT|nr:hypothetical protein AaE_013038 [Aphanomyces astaci]
MKRSKRTIKAPKRFETVAAVQAVVPHRPIETLTMADLATNAHRTEWEDAMAAEHASLLTNDVWVLTNLPKGRKALKSKWVWKVKYLSTGEIKRFKAHLVIKGFLQIAGVDFTDTFAPVVRLDSLRTVQLDIKTAFLNGELDETIYMVQPQGFEVPGEEGKVCLLKKALYGLKQATRQWHKKLDVFLCTLGFKRCYKDQCIYVLRDADNAVSALPCTWMT